MFPDTNDLQFARERNDFMSEPAVEQAAWPEAIGYEQTEDPYRHAEVPADINAAIDQIEAFANDAAQHAASVEHETAAEREQYVEYAAHVTRLVCTERTYAGSNVDIFEGLAA